ncbi:unannotated protein [freshwater metagenome]|uniref:Unannotated protein n=1 Tax=freshwater metagenome TaxID=449393 RepID=A0A6J7IA32_9ZZZZ
MAGRVGRRPKPRLGHVSMYSAYAGPSATGTSRSWAAVARTTSERTR